MDTERAGDHPGPEAAVASGVRPTHAVILAAGRGRRMGGPKAWLRLDGRTLLEAHVARWIGAGLRVVAVVEDAAAWAEHFGAGVELRENPDPLGTDMARSVQIGLAGLGHAILLPVDTPPAGESLIRALLGGVGDAVPTWGGRDGHPVRLAPPHPPGRLDHRLRDAPRIAVDDPHCVLDFDTREDWARWLASR